MKLALILLTGIVLTGCGEGRLTNGSTCMPDGSVVWYQFQNADGNYKGAKADPKNCS